MDIDPETFYGLFILHFEVEKEEKEIFKCPLFLQKMIGMNMVSAKMYSGDVKYKLTLFKKNFKYFHMLSSFLEIFG